MGTPSRRFGPGNQREERRDTPNQPLPRFTTTSEAYAHPLYQGEAQDEDIATFLEDNCAYDPKERMWSMPSAPTTQGDLLSSVFKVIQSVIGVFVKPTLEGVEREAVVTHGIPGLGLEDNKAPECPVLVVRAAGPSFETPSSSVPSGVGFSNIATYLSVKLDSEMGDAADNLDEMVTYAQQIFREQPNRIHVRSLIVTEKHARLVHFDRAGSQITPLIDIHRHPETLIRLIAGLSSTNERTLGLDDSIQWTIVDGKKSQGTLTTTGTSGERKTYPILEQIPIPRDWIRGRATTCWRVQDPDTLEVLMVKDSWRPEDRVAEFELLELAKDVPGVVQMVSYETGRGETKDFRCPTTSGRYHNRVATRVTMKCYGGSIESFKSTLQLLCALRDVVAGHERLVGDDIQILHRDISPSNILLGREGATEGNRGVLIDFDLAFKATPDHPVVIVDHNIGTRIFQSLSVVESFSIRVNKHQHDYLDDLESFLYVLTYLFLSFRPDGSRVPSKDEGPSITWQWAEQRPEAAACNKRGLFGFGEDYDTAFEVVEKYWGPACFALFEQFHDWATKVMDEKDRLVFRSGRRGRADILDPLHALREEHYAAVLKMFDDAIDKINAESTGPPPIPNEVLISPQPASPAALAVKGARAPSQDLDKLNFPAPHPVIDADAVTASSSPPPTFVVTQPRRSTRILNLRLANRDPPSLPAPKRLPPPTKATTAPSHPALTQTRRSTRLLKRRLGDADEDPGVPRLEARRVVKRPRGTTRSR